MATNQMLVNLRLRTVVGVTIPSKLLIRFRFYPDSCAVVHSFLSIVRPIAFPVE